MELLLGICSSWAWSPVHSAEDNDESRPFTQTLFPPLHRSFVLCVENVHLSPLWEFILMSFTVPQELEA